MANHSHSALGFTLVELMIAIAILSIVMTLAVPSFQSVIRDNRIVTEANELVTLMNLARSEAIKRGLKVGVCTSTTPLVAAPTCNGARGDWSGGWLVFAAGPANTTSPLTFNSLTDTLIKVKAPNPSITVTTDLNTTITLEYLPDGTINQGSTARFAVCDSRGVERGREVIIRPLGRLRMVRPVSSCSQPT